MSTIYTKLTELLDKKNEDLEENYFQDNERLQKVWKGLSFNLRGTEIIDRMKIFSPLFIKAYSEWYPYNSKNDKDKCEKKAGHYYELGFTYEEIEERIKQHSAHPLKLIHFVVTIACFCFSSFSSKQNLIRDLNSFI